MNRASSLICKHINLGHRDIQFRLSIMTSWALMVDVYYLPPARRKENEDPVDFAKRVKHLIAKKGGLIDLDWDGNLKRASVPDHLKDATKERFFNYLSKTRTLLNCTQDNKGLKNTVVCLLNKLNMLDFRRVCQIWID